MSNISDSPTFCPAPWTHICLELGGLTRTCTYGRTVLGNSRDQSVEDILKGNVLQDIKQSIANGEWNPNCVYCKDSEQVGGRSERELNLKFVKQSTVDVINADIDYHCVEHASVNWNNLCNLSCTYCGPRNSSGWSKKLNIPIAIDVNKEESAVEYIAGNKNTLHSLLLGGGEPLLQKSVERLLTKLNPSTAISITTNLSVPLENNPVFNTILKSNLQVTWMISFDGIGDKFEYVRDGADWELFKHNISVLQQHNQSVVAHPAYSLYCAFDLKEYYAFCIEQGLPVFWCDLFAPEALDVRQMPKRLRDMAIAEIDHILDLYKERTDLSLDTLTQYRDMCVNGRGANTFIRPVDVLAFHNKIEQQLGKAVTYADLWPNIYSILKEMS